MGRKRQRKSQKAVDYSKLEERKLLTGETMYAYIVDQFERLRSGVRN